MPEDTSDPRPADLVPGADGDPSAEDSSTSSSSLDELADDLRRVVGMRSPAALRDAHLPRLVVYLPEPENVDRLLDGIRQVIADGLGAIEDPQFQSAARALFAFEDGRWTPLRQRGERASASFNCSFDAYRRARRSTGISLLDETVRQLAGAIITQNRPSDSAADGPPPPTEPENRPPSDATPPTVPIGPGTPRSKRGPVLVGAAVLALVILVVAVVVMTRGGDGPATSVAAPATTVPIGTTTAPPKCVPIGEANHPDLVAYRVPFRTEVAQLTPPGEAIPCGVAPARRWDQLVIQHLTKGGKGAGTLVAVDPDHVLWMTDAEFGSYFQIGGKDGTRAQNLEGLPRRRAMSASSKVWLIITDHGALASEGVDQPGYYLGGPVWSGWTSKGEDEGTWGIPASNPLNNAVGYYQDFSNGRLTLSYDGSLDFHRVDDPAAALPTDSRGNILRHDDGTTWYVDARAIRHWIPDGATWECLHKRGAREIGHVPGYAITTLKLGDPAVCPGKETSTTR